MSELFPQLNLLSAEEERTRRVRALTGILPSQQIRDLISKGSIGSDLVIDDELIQPASLDLRLGKIAHQVSASFLPGLDRTVEEKIEQFGTDKFDLVGGATLKKGRVYVVKLQEKVRLTKDVSGIANPKSSIGRLDIFTRLIANNSTEFDKLPFGYEGPLYAEISPLTFDVTVREGSRLNQLRFVRGNPRMAKKATRELLDGLGQDHPYRDGSPITVDLQGYGASGLVGFQALKDTPPVDVDAKELYDPHVFWKPIQAAELPSLTLVPGEFYILVSCEAFQVPPDHAAEMVAYDTLVGEFRVHYAGFFDPGFGYDKTGGRGTRAVLEVRSHEVPFVIEHGQIVGRLLYERLSAKPDKLYGKAIGSSYQHQGLTLGKQFRRYQR